MIKTEIVTINGKQYRRTWSDNGFMIEREGTRYGEAIDPLNSDTSYIETDIPIETESITEVEEKAIAYDILMGATK